MRRRKHKKINNEEALEDAGVVVDQELNENNPEQVEKVLNALCKGSIFYSHKDSRFGKDHLLKLQLHESKMWLEISHPKPEKGFAKTFAKTTSAVAQEPSKQYLFIVDVHDLVKVPSSKTPDQLGSTVQCRCRVLFDTCASCVLGFCGGENERHD